MFKKCKAVMLPTNEKALNTILLNPSTNKIELSKGYLAKEYQDVGYKTLYLYIISEDKIENGDWFVNFSTGLIHQAGEYAHICHKPEDNHCKKIIATTNSSLKWSDDNDIQVIDYHFAKLPQPTQSFIEMYVEEYNRGNVITDALVEYEEIPLTIEDLDYPDLDGGYRPEFKLKINSKDNTITIKKVKDSWSREEHIEGMWEAYKASNTTFEDEDALKQEFNNWIENLKL